MHIIWSRAYWLLVYVTRFVYLFLCIHNGELLKLTDCFVTHVTFIKNLQQ